MESFLLELGRGWAFVERQKRITFDGDDYYLDLLFYSRPLRRLIAVELKVGKFKPSYQGQMNFYLKWLDRHERQADENPPIGLILCTEASRDQIELLEMHKDGIVVAEYWTALPPKAELEVMTRAYKTPNWPAAWAKEDAQHRGGPLRTMTKHDVQVQLRAITEQSRLFRDVLSRARHGFASELRMAVWRNRMMSTFNYHSACELVVHWIKRLSPAIAFSPTVCRDEPRTDRRGQSR